MKIYERCDKLSNKGFGSFNTIDRGPTNEYRIGYFTFKGGTVRIYSEPGITCFDFVYNGKQYSKRISQWMDKKKRKPYTNLGLLRMAGAFAKKVIAEQSKIQ